MIWYRYLAMMHLIRGIIVLDGHHRYLLPFAKNGIFVVSFIEVEI